jgi:hypothetical protein
MKNNKYTLLCLLFITSKGNGIYNVNDEIWKKQLYVRSAKHPEKKIKIKIWFLFKNRSILSSTQGKYISTASIHPSI